VAGAGWLLLAGMPSHAEILTLFADTGFAVGISTTVPIYSGCGYPSSFIVALGTATDIVPPEGYSSWLMSSSNNNCGYFGWGPQYNVGTDLSRFSAGAIRFWINSSTGAVKLDIQDTSGYEAEMRLDSYIGTSYNQWIFVSIPFSSMPGISYVQMNTILNPFLFTSLVGLASFHIDDVQYVTSDISANYFNVALMNSSDNSTATQVTWTGAVAGSSWALADQYIQLTVDSDLTSWGVQIYTDNTASDANPAYTGTVSSTTPGGGLVDASATGVVLPVAWEIVAVTSPTLNAQEPNSCPGNGLGCLWSYMTDYATFSQGNPSVYNGAPYVTLRNNYGIHYAQGGAANDPSHFGAANPPNIVYLEANFAQALVGTTYQTTTLRVEYYTQ
jgi:hypothetical protein